MPGEHKAVSSMCGTDARACRGSPLRDRADRVPQWIEPRRIRHEQLTSGNNAHLEYGSAALPVP
jgi:hypothetical protein